jgi:hypothetical protein
VQRVDCDQDSATARRSLFADCESDHLYNRRATPKEEAAALRNRNQQRVKDYMDKKSIADDERQELTAVLEDPQSSEQDVAKAVFNTRSLMKAIESTIINDVNMMADRLCSITQEPGPSVLRTLAKTENLQQGYDVLSEAAIELGKAMPFFHDLLVTLCNPPHITKPNTQHTVAMVYGMAMYNRNNHLSALQKLNTAAAVRMHANNDLLELLHKTGITLAASYKLQFLDQLGTFNMEGVVSSIKQGKPGKITMDNIDGMIVANQLRLGIKNRHYHYTASTYYPDRCDVTHLSMARPRIPAIIDPTVFYLSEHEQRILKENYGYQVLT